MERRDYSRFNIGVPSVFVIEDKEVYPRDFEGTIIEISESGCGIMVSDGYEKTIANLHPDEMVHFNIPDDFNLLGQDVSVLVSGRIKIIRKTLEEGKTVLGCKFVGVNKKLEEYISDKRMLLYMKNINKRQYMSIE